MPDGRDLSIGVVVVAYGSADVIEDCLTSLLASDFPNLSIAVVDNASPDDTAERVRAVATAAGVTFQEIDASTASAAPARITLIRARENTGYAGGVNIGLRFFRQVGDTSLFWVLNPDSVVLPETAGAYARKAAAAGRFSLMAGRTLYYDSGGRIQSDGGRVNLWTGVCRNLNQGKLAKETTMPPAAAVNFLSGANIVASREFVERVGPMEERYFLYYEEVDWAMRRKDMPLVLVPEAIVLHHGGTAIGSGAVGRLPSAFSNYFNYRNRILFTLRFNPLGLPLAYGYSVLRIVRLLLQGAPESARGAWRGLHLLPPPKEVASRIERAAWPRAFPPRRALLRGIFTR